MQYSGAKRLMKLGFSEHMFKNTQISNFIKIHPVRAELLHTDKRTERGMERRTKRGMDKRTDRYDEGNSRFSQFCKRA
jgi:hypothetical protein